MPDLAPTQEMLKAYRDGQVNWDEYERQFLSLMRDRNVEKMPIKEKIADAVLLCSEETAEHCHRRLVAEYLQKSVGRRGDHPPRLNPNVPHDGKPIAGYNGLYAPARRLV